MAEQIPKSPENKQEKTDIAKLNTELIKWLTFEQRLDTRERLQINLNRAKELLDNMHNIINTFDLDKYSTTIVSQLVPALQNTMISRFESTSNMFEKVLSEIKSTKVWMSEQEIKLILSYEDLYYKYNNLISDNITKDYSKRMNYKYE